MTEKKAPSVNLHVRVSAKQYDATYASAQAARLSMADWIRRVLQAATNAKQPGRRHAS